MLRSTRPLVSKVGTNAVRSVGARNVSAMSTPSLINIEKRWDTMSSEEREDIISQLAERQKGPWKELTPEEKKAAWYISYGAWGPRKPIHAAGDAKKIWLGVFGALGGAFVLLNLSKYIFGHESRTMNKEWQEASNEILKENKANPFSGYDQVQSSSGGPKVDDEE